MLSVGKRRGFAATATPAQAALAIAEQSPTLVGTDGPVGPAFFTDGFESGDLSHREGNARWTFIDSGISVESENPIEGSFSCRCQYEGSSLGDDDNQELFFDLGRDVEDLWMRWLLRIPDNYYHRPDGASSNNKLLKVGSHYQGGSSQGINFMWEYRPYPSHLSADGSSMLGWHWTNLGVSSSGHEQLTRVWGPAEAGTVQELIFRLKMSSAVGVNDGIIQCWHKPEGGSFTRIHHYTTAPFYPSSSYPTQTRWKGGYCFGWLNASFENDTAFGLDGVQWAESNIWGVA